MSNPENRQVKGYVNDEINGVDSSQLTDAAAKKWSDLPTDKDINVPQLLDLTEDNLTENVIRINSQGKANPRLNYVLSKLVRVLHDFVKDVDLQTDEWEQTWQFLTKCGQISDDTRHEFILLSDILGISALVDTITYPRVEGATESSVLGPFFDDAAHEVANGESICSENRGEVTVVRGRVTDAKTGKPIANTLIEYLPPLAVLTIVSGKRMAMDSTTFNMSKEKVQISEVDCIPAKMELITSSLSNLFRIQSPTMVPWGIYFVNWVVIG
jgi:hypothetical protein